MATYTLTGVTFHKGEYEGRAFHFTKVYLLSPMPANPTTVGFKTVDMKTADPDMFETLKKLPFPCEADVSLDVRASNKPGESTMVITGVRPVSKAAA